MKNKFLLGAILGLYLPFGFAAHNPHSVRNAFMGSRIELMFEDVKGRGVSFIVKEERAGLFRDLSNINEDSQRQNRKKAIDIILNYSGKIANNSSHTEKKERLLYELSLLLNLPTMNGKKAWEILEESEDYGIEIEPESGKVFCRSPKKDTLLHVGSLTKEINIQKYLYPYNQ